MKLPPSRDQLLRDALGDDGAAAVERAVADRPGLAGALRPRVALAWAQAALEHGYRGPLPGRPDVLAEVAKGEVWELSGAVEASGGPNAPHLAAHALALAGGPVALAPVRRLKAMARLGLNLDLLAVALVKGELEKASSPGAPKAPRAGGAGGQHAGVEPPGPHAAPTPPKPPAAAAPPAAPRNGAAVAPKASAVGVPGTKPPKPPGAMKAEDLRKDAKVVPMPGAAAQLPPQPDRKAGGKKVVSLASRRPAPEPTAGDPDEYHRAAAAAEDKGDPDTARGLYEAALRANPRHADAHVNLGRIKHEGGDVEGALGHYDAAAAARPRDPTIHFNRGVALEDLGRNPEAVQAYQQSLKAKPTADTHYNLARLLEQAGDQRGAIQHMTRHRQLQRDGAAPAPPSLKEVPQDAAPPRGPAPGPKGPPGLRLVRSEPAVHLTKAELARACGTCGQPQLRPAGLVGCACFQDVLTKAEIVPTEDGAGYAVRLSDREAMVSFVEAVRG